jgi:hypothetical protein
MFPSRLRMMTVSPESTALRTFGNSRKSSVTVVCIQKTCLIICLMSTRGESRFLNRGGPRDACGCVSAEDGFLSNAGSSLFSVGTFSLAPEREGSDPQMAQIAADVFRVSTPLLVLRNLRLVTKSCQSFA